MDIIGWILLHNKNHNLEMTACDLTDQWSTIIVHKIMEHMADGLTQKTWGRGPYSSFPQKWKGMDEKEDVCGLKTLCLFPISCRSGPVWTALCSCHSSHREPLGSLQWCWPTIALRVFSGSSQKFLRCRAWLSCWWCGITRTRVLLRVSVTIVLNTEFRCLSLVNVHLWWWLPQCQL